MRPARSAEDFGSPLLLNSWKRGLWFSTFQKCKKKSFFWKLTRWLSAPALQTPFSLNVVVIVSPPGVFCVGSCLYRFSRSFFRWTRPTPEMTMMMAIKIEAQLIPLWISGVSSLLIKSSQISEVHSSSFPAQLKYNVYKLLQTSNVAVASNVPQSHRRRTMLIWANNSYLAYFIDIIEGLFLKLTSYSTV